MDWWAEVGHRVQVIHSHRIEEPGQIDRVLGGVYRDLHGPIRHHWDGAFGVAPWSPKRASFRAPKPLLALELDPFALEAIGERIHGVGS